MSEMNKNNCKVKLLGHTKNGEKILAGAALISRTAGDAVTVFKKTHSHNENKKVINIVKNLGHTSYLEHLSFSFALNDVSAAFEQYLIEYRLASYTIKSRRYVDFSTAGFNEFGVFKDDKNLNNIYNKHMEKPFKLYGVFVNSGVEVEDARYILPYCYRSNIIFSANARELRHILYRMLYIDGPKQAEILAIGNQIYKIVGKLYPTVFNNLDANEEIFKPIQEDFVIDGTSRITDSKVDNIVMLTDWSSKSEKSIIMSVLISLGKFSSSNLKTIMEDEKLKQECLNYAFSRTSKRDLEKVDLTYIIENLSLANLTHFTRHRMQSLTLPSISTAIQNNNYIIPPTIEENDALKRNYIEMYEANKYMYDKLKNEGISPYELIYFALSGNTIDLMTKFNAREALTLFRLRCCNRAQWEINGVATEMLRQARLVLPDIFDKMGPSCYMMGKCPEKKLSCKKMEKTIEKFQHLL